MAATSSFDYETWGVGEQAMMHATTRPVSTDKKRLGEILQKIIIIIIIKRARVLKLVFCFTTVCITEFIL